MSKVTNITRNPYRDILVGETHKNKKVYIDYLNPTLIFDTEDGKVLKTLMKELETKRCEVYNLDFSEYGKLKLDVKGILKEVVNTINERYQTMKENGETPITARLTPIVITGFSKAGFEQDKEISGLLHQIAALGRGAAIFLYLSTPAPYSAVKISTSWANNFLTNISVNSENVAYIQARLGSKAKKVLVK